MLAFTQMVDFTPSPGHTLPHKPWLLLECSGNMLASENPSLQLSAKKGMLNDLRPMESKQGLWGFPEHSWAPGVAVCIGDRALTLTKPCTHSKPWGCPWWPSEGVILRHPSSGSEILPLCWVDSTQHLWALATNGVALCGFWPTRIHFLKELFSSFQGCHRKAGIPVSR